MDVQNDFEIEFMRKSRFEKIKNKFVEINPKAKKVIDRANPNEILLLVLAFSSPKVIKAAIFDEKKFINMAF